MLEIIDIEGDAEKYIEAVEEAEELYLSLVEMILLNKKLNNPVLERIIEDFING
jgi:hypothetical protein